MVKLQPLNVVRKIRIIPYSKALYFLLLLSAIYSCDPARVLIVRSAYPEQALVTIYADQAFLPSIYSADTGQVSITVPDSAGNSELIFMYGLGGWANDSLLYQMSGQVDSICFIGIQGNHTLYLQDEIYDYLRLRRSGFASRKLTITAR